MSDKYAEVDTSTVKYAIYIRKSTDDPQKQAKSTEDQLAECWFLINRLNLPVIGEPIIEKKSAKKPGIRPKFTKLIADIRKGIYTGIISWNPDRLARNMKEAGEIIDMIDENLISDLKFVTHHFTKDANGKMLLGMAFVLSKQYSDKLSADVGRGIDARLEEGKGSSYKHGYRRNEHGFQVPDGNNYNFIHEAWSMRKEGKSLESIAEFMRLSGYARIIKSTGKKVSMTKQTLSLIFRDPFYYGMLVQTDQQVDLRKQFNFQPAVSEDDFFAIQAMAKGKSKPYKLKRKIFYPFRMMITCSYCNNHMYPGASKSSNGEHLLYYRCDNKNCTRPKKSIRAKIILEFIYDFLSSNLSFTAEDYLHLQKQMKGHSAQIKKRLQQDFFVKNSQSRRVVSEIKELTFELTKKSKLLGKGANYVTEKINQLCSERDQLTKEIEKIKLKIGYSDQELLTSEQFLNLSKNAARAVQFGDTVIKDTICRFIFLNFTVDDEKVLSYQLKDPFYTLLKGSLSKNVGVPRLELGTSASQTRRSTI